MTYTGGVVDTLGAGDTFNAAVIGCLAAGLGLAESVDTGCRVNCVLYSAVTITNCVLKEEKSVLI